MNVCSQDDILFKFNKRTMLFQINESKLLYERYLNECLHVEIIANFVLIQSFKARLMFTGIGLFFLVNIFLRLKKACIDLMPCTTKIHKHMMK